MNSISTVTIGALKEEGGSRSHTVTIGGQREMPFLSSQGCMPHKPVVAFEVWDCLPRDWPLELLRAYGDALKDPVAWARTCVERHGAELLCVKLTGAHPSSGGRGVRDEVDIVRELLKTVSVPLVITGCGDESADNAVLPAVSEAAKGERCLIGSVVQENYKTVTAAVSADGHAVIAESPIDVNIAKQLNILVSDLGLPLERIVMDPTIGALGYGLEYAYSIMERARLAAFSGDRTIAAPFICFVGQESWKAKEAYAPRREFPAWGDEVERGIFWEIVTAAALLQSGADILVMRHPVAVERIKTYIDRLTASV